MSSPTKEEADKVDKSTPPSTPSGAPKSGSPPPSYDVAKASPNARSSPTPAETPAVPETGVDKEAVKELSAMFPIIDVAVIEAVLESTGSKDAAAEHLLGMTDPSFVPDAAPSERERQASLDADFAQALHFQDRQNHADHFPPPPRAPPYQGRGVAHAQARATDASRRVRDTLAARLDRHEKPFDPATYVPPYQPRVRKARAPRHGPSPYDGDYARVHELQQKYGEEDVQFTEFEKKVLHIAEQGKQTFSSLINRARAKYDEFSDQRDHGQNPESSTARPGGLWGSPRSHDPHAAYAGSTKSAHWSPSDLDDVEDAQPLSPHAVSGKISPPRSGNNSGTASPASPSGRPSSPGKIDLAKLGFLPKRRVELLSASGDNSVQSPTTPTHPEEKSKHRRVPSVSPHQLGDSDDDDDDDDLGYTVNPFDKK